MSSTAEVETVIDGNAGRDSIERGRKRGGGKDTRRVVRQRQTARKEERAHAQKPKHTDILHTMLSFNTDHVRVCKMAAKVSEMGGCARQH